MRDVFLVCEGTHGQIDQRVLDSLVITAHGVPARIKPAGGSSSLGALRTFLEQEATRGPAAASIVRPAVFTVKDRDFQPLVKAAATWADISCHQLIWRRHEIENYLVEPAVVHTWFETLRLKPPPRMAVAQLPTTLAQVETLIESLARDLLEHHVGQLVFAEIQQSCRYYTDTTQLSRPARSGSVVLDPNRSPAPKRRDWLNALNVEWRRVERNRHKSGRIPSWTTSRIRQQFDARFTDLSLPSYFAQKTYLLDFEGKGLLWALSNWLRQLTGISISNDQLESDLIGVLPTAYSQFQPYQPDEFLDLATRMKRASQ